jgi:hypothetical protein
MRQVSLVHCSDEVQPEPIPTDDEAAQDPSHIQRTPGNLFNVYGDIRHIRRYRCAVGTKYQLKRSMPFRARSRQRKSAAEGTNSNALHGAAEEPKQKQVFAPCSTTAMSRQN